MHLAQERAYVAVYCEVLADMLTPISVFNALVNKGDHAILLESGLRFNESGSTSFIGLHPYATLQTRKGETVITANGAITTTSSLPPLELLRTFQQQFHCASDEFSKLAGHMMGFLAYDAVRYFENIPDKHANEDNFPDILFHFYRINLIFDHVTNKLLIAVIADSSSCSKEDAYDKAYQEIAVLLKKVTEFSPQLDHFNFSSQGQSANESSFTTDCEDEVFQQKVEEAKKYIHAGDAFQIVLSRTFSKPSHADPFIIYRILRYSNLTPYMFYLTCPDYSVFGASPEKLVSLHNHVVTIAPIAGTSPISEESTETITQRLREDEKENAEHTMLVDLARNDMGVVCEPGSVHVTDLMLGLRLTHVVHLVSYVKGKLAPGYDAFDVLKSAFPAGTLSGAPKIRAMEIIDALESSKRQLYGGAICKIDGEGNLDSCIAIRTGILRNGIIKVRAGGGLVFDSDPAKEAQETRHKARGVLRAVALAEHNKSPLPVGEG